MVEIRVLGPVVVAGPNGVGAPSSVVARTLLAALALAGPGGLTDARLADAVWGAAGADKVAGLSVAVTRTRQWLDAHVGGRVRIERTTAGYALTGCVVDAQRFVELVDAGRLVEALALWRGEPMADGTMHSALEPAIVGLQERRREAVIRHGRALLDQGRAGEAVATLRPLAEQNELDEPLQSAVIEALAESGRQAEALRRHERVRGRLRDELGVEPGPELHNALLRILRDEPPAGQPIGSWTAPAQLPGAVADFTGRAEVLQQLDKLVAVQDAGAVPIAAIAGTAGVGKTTLAVRWAHQIADRYPDGQLFVNLNGYSASPPADPAQALASMLQAMGVAGDTIPDDLDSRAALYRTCLAARRVLIVLDNARSPDQVRPLLPGDPGCLVVITSRDALGGLVAVDGARRVELDVLPCDEAHVLLAALLGAERVALESDAAEELLDLCAGLPLALRVAAANVGSQPIAAYVDVLRADRLGELTADSDPYTVLGTHFDHSYEHLAPGEQDLFRLLGLPPGPDIDPYAAAALADCPLADARRILRRLANAHLVIEHAPGRYGCHDLLRAYARQRVHAEDDAGQPALRRLFAWYLASAAQAVSHVAPGRVRLPELPPIHAELPRLDNYEQAMDWLETERANLLASITHAADHDWHDHAWKLPQTLWRYFMVRGYLQDWQRTHQQALEATRRLSDRSAEAEIQHSLATAEQVSGAYPQAFSRFQGALSLRRELADQEGEARTLNGLAITCRRIGDFSEALAHFEQALALFRGLDQPAGVADVLINLGDVFDCLGHYSESLDYHSQARVLYGQLRDARGEAAVLLNRGIVQSRIGSHSAAIASVRESLGLIRSLGDRPFETNALRDLGDIYLRVGRYDDALDCYGQALLLVRETGDVDDECEIRDGLGRVYGATGDYERAVAEHERALVLTATTGNRYQRARAHHGIAGARHDAGEHGSAHEHWARAVDLYTELGVPEAEPIRAVLAGLDPVCRSDVADL